MINPLGFVRPGYTVEVREDPSSIAHTHHRIGLHTDLTFYDYMPGVNNNINDYKCDTDML